LSAQIRRKNDRSKLVEQESGRRLYASDLPYEEAMDQLSQKYLDSVKLIKQSEFKKPYLEDDYSAMEYAYNPPSWPINPYAPPNPGDSVIPDCRVGVEAAGALEDWRDCAEGDSCAGWVFTCAHKLISIGCGNCTIAKIEPLEGDRLMVIICSDRDALDIQVQTSEDPSKPAAWKSFEQKRECCPTTKACGGKCDGCPPPVIGYTSQQMSCSGTQTLTHASGGAGGPYTWSTDYGSFSAPTGTSVVFTAPSANGNCAYNPTITLTDCCGHTGTLAIAVNCGGTGVNAYKGNPSWQCGVSLGTCYCGGTYRNLDCSDADLSSAGVLCSEVQVPGGLCAPGCSAACSGKPTSCPSYYDTRTTAQKEAGCCPAGLL